jgi:uncharacterized protein (TIGR02687 family)
MTEIQNKIIGYFEQNPDLRVLFIFHDSFLVDELRTMDWEAKGYKLIEFKGDWFTTKYRLDHEWADKKVIMTFEQYSPLEDPALQEKFPLMDVLTANMEYHSQDYASFMQQHDLPATMMQFVKENVQQLQSSKMMKLLQPYFSDHSFTEDVGVRAFLCNFLGLQQIREWDSIILRILFLSCPGEEKKSLDFYNKLLRNKILKQRLQDKLTAVFGVGIDENTEEKVEDIIKVFKYNAIVQNLAPVDTDNYKQERITDSLGLQQMNRLLELALSTDKSADALMQLFEKLGKSIRDDELIRWYGTDANFYFVPRHLCLPILKTLLEQKLETEPGAVVEKVEDLLLKHNDHDETAKVMNFTIIAAHLYQKVDAVGSLTLDSPDEYVRRYTEDYYMIDQLYRQAQECYFNIDPSCELFGTVQEAKKNLDLYYSKFCNRLNLEWTRCIKETGGMSGIHLLRQQDFYRKCIQPLQKKVVVIVSDALRYEVAQELTGALAKSRHVATLKPALAMLPTETKYCKPALLPYKELKLYGQEDHQDMSVDDHVLSTTEKRSEHLQKYKEGAVCVPFETVAEYNLDKNREIFKHPLVYIFHDIIDKTGHEGNARQVATSCREAINELSTMILKILASYNVTEVYVTSDHGFLFNDITFADKDKHKVEEKTLERSTRYYLTHSDNPISGIMKFPLSEVSAMSNVGDVFVAVPEGTNRLAAPSGGYLFTHGGASLQEMLIPVIASHQERTDSKQSVGVTVLDRNLSVQASRIRFKLLQTDMVSMDTKERVITVALYDHEEPVTQLQTITLDKSDPSLDNRKIQVDLTLNKNVETKVLQLIVYDINDDMNPLIKENVTNNTLIENDFDF